MVPFNFARPARRFVVALLLVVGFRDAEAQFKPLNCAACPTLTPVDFSFSSSEFPRDPHCVGSTCPSYIPGIHHTRFVVGNQNIKQILFDVPFIDVQGGSADYLDFGDSVSNVVTRYSGAYTSRTVSKILTYNAMNSPAKIVFHADESDSRQGFNISGAQVCCEAPTRAAAFPMPFVTPVTGILLGTSDVVYFAVPTRSLNEQVNVLLRARSGGGTDFDLFARCNAYPELNGVGTVVSNSSDSDEFLSLPHQCNGTWYFAVWSYNGSGTFEIMASPMYANRSFNLNVGIESTDATEIAAISNTLRQASRRYYGSSEGEQFVRNYQLFTGQTVDAGCPSCGGGRCAVCFRSAAGRSNATFRNSDCAAGTPGTINMHRSTWQSPAVLAHEFGHSLACIDDEYLDVLPDGGFAAGGHPDAIASRSQCLHTMMSSSGGSSTNWCLSNPTFRDHGVVQASFGPLPAPPPPTFSSSWETAYSAGAVPYMPSESPSNEIYQLHDFANLISVQ